MFQVFWHYCDKKPASLKCFSLVPVPATFQTNVNSLLKMRKALSWHWGCRNRSPIGKKKYPKTSIHICLKRQGFSKIFQYLLNFRYTSRWNIDLTQGMAKLTLASEQERHFTWMYTSMLNCCGEQGWSAWGGGWPFILGLCHTWMLLDIWTPVTLTSCLQPEQHFVEHV